MSETAATTGEALIDVDGADVTCSERVRAVQRNLTWIVHNTTGPTTHVGVTGFRRGDQRFPDLFEWLTDNPVEVLAGQRRAIVGRAVGPRGLYDYDVTLEGQVVEDPQLDI